MARKFVFEFGLGLAAWRADVNTSAPQKWASCQFPNPVMVESKH